MDKILGIGNALVDIMTRLKDDQLLEEFNLPKGSMQLVEADFIKKLSIATDNLDKSQSSGGSAANTIHGLARLGAATGFVGKVGDDELGNFFKKDLENNNVTPELLISKTTSGRAMALVSEDSERTFATFLGAAIEMGSNDVKQQWFDGYTYLHIEGYLVQNHDLLERTAKLAKKKGLIISLDLASYNIVEDNLSFLQHFVKHYVDIVFANEEEAKAFTGKEPKQALNELAEITDMAVVKVGKEGSMVQKGTKVWKIDPIIANPVDTTGAGDAYAAGFLYGLTQDYDPEQCGNIGSVMAGKVIEGMGAKMDDVQWKEVFRNLPETAGKS